jgi:hypothetical protein
MLIRRTRSVCAICAQPCDAEVVEADGEARLVKRCPIHGETRCRLSRHPEYYLGLDRYYFAVMRTVAPQRDYLLRLNERCNLRCPICLASAGRDEGVVPPLTRERLAEFLASRDRPLKIDLLSAEPTLRSDLFDIVRELKRAGHMVALHTNGLRLGSASYCRALREAGVDEVHLQMDGFDDEAYRAIRGRPLSASKRRAMTNLEREDLATDLVMVIMPGANEREIGPVLADCLDRPFVRELFFLGTRPLGFFAEREEVLMPDDVIDIVERESGGLCRRSDVFRFQKLYFALLSVLGVRKCLYIQHYLLFREGAENEQAGRWRPVSEIVDWRRVEPILDELPSLPSRWTPRKLGWAFRLVGSLLSWRALRYVPDVLAMLLHLRYGWRLSTLPRRILLIGYITACDPHNFDEDVARHCGKGELSMDCGEQESGADANVMRERRWRAQRE